MNKRLIAHVDELFIGIKKDQQAMEIKEELLTNLDEKYEDLIAQGKNETEAFQAVTESIGDMRELVSDLYGTGEFNDSDIKKNRGIRSILLSFAASIYMLSLAVVFLFDQLLLYNVGIVIMLVMWAAASGLIVYGNSLGRYKYEKKDNTFAESYKEQLSQNEKAKRIGSTLSSLVWTGTAALYFAVSFAFGDWEVTWILLFVGLILQMLVLYLYGKRKNREYYFGGMLFAATLVIYFVVSFGLNSWEWSWIIFILTVAVYQIIKLMRIWRDGV